MPTPDEYREMAVQDYRADDLEIDVDAKVSVVAEGASGAWVAAWVWVGDDRFDNGE
jgi:hypothetical protein